MPNFPRLAIVGTHSGCGKTTVALALIGAYVKRGEAVTAFKCGPDYIDSTFHRKSQHISCYNLDSIFLSDAALVQHFTQHASPDLSLIEGVMGMFDGVGPEGKGSSFQIAQTLQAPLILVINGRGMSTSVRALIRGFLSYAENTIDGIIFTNISPMYYPMMKSYCEEEKIKCFGFIPKDDTIQFQSRHLGLIGITEVEEISQKLAKLTCLCEKYVDLDGLLTLAQNAEPLLPSVKKQEKAKHSVTLALASDDAFCFTYQENLELLEEKGVHLIPFSPLKDSSLPSHIDGLYLPGGYPELHKDALSNNTSLLKEIKERIEQGLPTLAECGGFLYLHSFVDHTQMVGLFPGCCTKSDHLQHFGYGTLTSLTDNVLFEKGERTTVHEFHYYQSTQEGESCIERKLRNGKENQCVIATDTLFAGFPHLYFPSQPSMVDRFIDHMKNYKEHSHT